jgi:hypothetical protein
VTRTAVADKVREATRDVADMRAYRVIGNTRCPDVSDVATSSALSSG